MKQYINSELVDLNDNDLLILEQHKSDAVEASKYKYIFLRQRSYPSMADYLDGLVKEDQAQIDKYISDCKAVKDKYPKS